MLRSIRIAVACAWVFTLIGVLGGPASAGTIIKLSLGSDTPPDIEFDGTTLSTIDDGDVGTTGDQNTNVDFLDFLTLFPNILTPTASLSLDGLTTAGPATVFAGVLVIQNFTGGTLELYDPANTLLLSGTLDDSTLTGPLGPPATGALFTTSFGLVTGGLLAPFIEKDTLTMSMGFSDVNGGAGFSVAGVAPLLSPFTADATLSIAAEPIPEPATSLLVFAGAMAILVHVAMRRRPSAVAGAHR